MSSEETQRLIAKDKEEHPNCDYSVSTSKSCRQTNGKMECETLHRVLRYCPGEGPCEILRNTLKSEGAPESSSEHALPSFGPSGGGLFTNDPQMEEQFKDMHRMLESFGGGLFGGLLGGAPGGGPFRSPNDHSMGRKNPPPPRDSSNAPQSSHPSRGNSGKPRGEVTEV
jgi:hypothetical protein